MRSKTKSRGKKSDFNRIDIIADFWYISFYLGMKLILFFKKTE